MAEPESIYSPEWLNRLLNSPSGNHETLTATAQSGTPLKPGLRPVPPRFQWENQLEAAAQLARQRRDEFKAHTPHRSPDYFFPWSTPRLPAIRPWS